jgi:hypothetical protein
MEKNSLTSADIDASVLMVATARAFTLLFLLMTDHYTDIYRLTTVTVVKT